MVALFGIAGVVARACLTYLLAHRASPPPNRAAEFQDIAPFQTVYGSAGSWMARFGPDAAPPREISAREAACLALADRVRAFKPGSVTLLSADGLPLARCP